METGSTSQIDPEILIYSFPRFLYFTVDLHIPYITPHLIESMKSVRAINYHVLVGISVSSHATGEELSSRFNKLRRQWGWGP